MANPDPVAINKATHIDNTSCFGFAHYIEECFLVENPMAKFQIILMNLGQLVIVHDIVYRGIQIKTASNFLIQVILGIGISNI